MRRASSMSCVISIALVALVPAGKAAPAPDLIVEEISVEPARPTTGGPFDVVVVVRNAGDAASGASVVIVQVGGESKPPRLGVPPLAAGSWYTTSREASIPTPGEYLITAKADATGAVAESNEANNQRTFSVTVEEARPDLVVSSLTYEPDQPTTLDRIVIVVDVRNEGDAEAEASTLSIRVGAEATPGTYSIPRLARGDTSRKEREIVLPSGGDYVVTAAADSGGAITEWREDNNARTVQIRVRKVEPDLIVSGITFSPPDPTTVDTIRIEAHVKNIGEAPASDTTACIRVGGEASPPALSVGSLQVGASRAISRDVVLSIAQLYTITVTADCGEDIAEEDEGNNHRAIQIRVLPGGPDLAIARLEHSPQDPRTGEMVEFTAWVENIGNASSAPSHAWIRIGSETSSPAMAVPALLPEQFQAIGRSFTFSSPGEVSVAAVADARKEIVELDEFNNEKKLSLTVDPPPVDLRISSLTFSPSAPAIHWPVTIEAEVRNEGVATAGAFHVSIQVGGESQPWVGAVPALQGGQTYATTREVTFTTPMDCDVTAIADAQEEVVEREEGNNSKTIAISVAAGPNPDLIVSGLSSIPSASAPGEQATIDVRVMNRGDMPAGSSRLEIRIAGDAAAGASHLEIRFEGGGTRSPPWRPARSIPARPAPSSTIRHSAWRAPIASSPSPMQTARSASTTR
ncbi:MAG: hypothetical protein JXP34_01055 [Planctomycetes bacterium]|nr:hypothetical protein [Planctomycetota bacterium]